MKPVAPLDATNLRLLAELSTDPRMSMSELARRIGMSSPAVTERVQRLEQSGVIAGYRLDVDPKALGFPVAAFVRIRPGPGQLRRIVELAERTPEVVECHRITGEDCFLMKVYVTEIDKLEEVLDRFLMHGQTASSIVQSSPVMLRSLPPSPRGGLGQTAERERGGLGRTAERERGGLGRTAEKES